MIQERAYRDLADNGLARHDLTIGETDLAIYVPACFDFAASSRALADEIIRHRRDLQAFIMEAPEFAASHAPLAVPVSAPLCARKMAEAAQAAMVGPMAAVAGYFAQLAGNFLLAAGAGEVIVENGGDIFLAGSRDYRIGIYAGESSPFTGQLAIQLEAKLLPCGVCTSSGTVGSSFSYGRADAAMIVAADTLLSDAAATYTANLVQKPEDVASACDRAMAIPGVLAALVVCEDQLAAAGAIKLLPAAAI